MEETYEESSKGDPSPTKGRDLGAVGEHQQRVGAANWLEVGLQGDWVLRSHPSRDETWKKGQEEIGVSGLQCQ